MKNPLKTGSTIQAALIVIGISLCIAMMQGCRTTHFFKTETLNHSAR
jgi:hypothetical protein